MGAACATADKYSIQDMRQHILADNFKDEMRKNWSLRFDKDQLKIAMKKLDIEPKAKDVLHFTVVTEIACVSYALADKSSETAANIGGGTEGASLCVQGRVHCKLTIQLPCGVTCSCVWQAVLLQV